MKKSAKCQTTSVRLLVVAGCGLAALFAGAPAQAGERTGKDIVESHCVSCHGTGSAGAPRIGDREAWAKRSAQGLASLTKHAVDGFRQMPAHGGNPQLTDNEMARAITYMVNRSGGNWSDPIARGEPTADRSGRQVVEARCIKCHGTGAGGAPMIGDRAAWSQRLRHGLDSTVRSAIQGHGAMAPRGGMAELTDAEIRNAVVYMFNPDPPRKSNAKAAK
jgi:cytochrome c5